MKNTLPGGIQQTEIRLENGDPSSLPLDRPIFIVGHARGGTTLLSGIVNWHTRVGSNYVGRESFPTINDFLQNIRNEKFHSDYGEAVEQKRVWFDYFPGENVYTHMGKDLLVETLELSFDERAALISRLTENFRGKRFLSKSPSNSFRVKIIPELFPESKIIAIYRSGPEVVNSWGQRGYGFGKRVNNYELRTRKLGYRKGIDIFSQKWFETLEYLESVRKKTWFLAITYDDLIENTSETLEKAFEYLELPIEDYIYDIKLDDRRSEWKKNIPWLHYRFLFKRTVEGMKLYDSVRTFKQ